ncbi:MAG TPA: hypothetical protein VIW22_03100, partial [Nitrososphaerales archaeon]
MSKTSASNLGFKLSIGVPLLVVAVAAWYLSAVLYQASTPMGMDSMAPAIPIATMAGMFTTLDAGVVVAFLVVWV